MCAILLQNEHFFVLILFKVFEERELLRGKTAQHS